MDFGDERRRHSRANDGRRWRGHRQGTPGFVSSLARCRHRSPIGRPATFALRGRQPRGQLVMQPCLCLLGGRQLLPRRHVLRRSSDCARGSAMQSIGDLDPVSLSCRIKGCPLALQWLERPLFDRSQRRPGIGRRSRPPKSDRFGRRGRRGGLGARHPRDHEGSADEHDDCRQRTCHEQSPRRAAFTVEDCHRVTPALSTASNRRSSASRVLTRRSLTGPMRSKMRWPALSDGRAGSSNS